MKMENERLRDTYIYIYIVPRFSRMKNYPKGVDIPWMGSIKLMSVVQNGRRENIEKKNF